LIKEDKNVYPLIPSCAIDIINKNSLYKDWCPKFCYIYRSLPIKE
jgi:hypothetical protein